MSKFTKSLLSIGALLIFAGCLLFVGVMMTLDWNPAKLSTVPYETNTYTVTSPFRSITIDTDTADIVFAASEDGACTVVCREHAQDKHSVTVKNKTLTVAPAEEKRVYGYFGINTESPKITVFLPEQMYSSLSVHCTTGDVEIPKDFHFEDVDISLTTGDVTFRARSSGPVRIDSTTGRIRAEGVHAAELDISVSTGSITVLDTICDGTLTADVTTGRTNLTGISCGALISTGTTGDITLENVIAADSFRIDRTTGDVTFHSCDAGEISAETSTGDVTGSLLTGKIFLTDTSTGSIDVPKTATGGICRISTSTGSIRITVLQP